MDFHTLPRKQLQALCKKNKIPANMTNVAMADSLAALDEVEGIEEVLNLVDTDAQKFPDEKAVGTPACRTSNRRKQVVEEPESSKITTRLRRGTRVRNEEETDQENKDLNVPATPAAPTTRRRAPAASARRKKEDEKSAADVPKTPAAAPSSRVKATSAYNTRKSVRLLEKNLSKMSLVDKGETESVSVDEISKELTSVSQQIEDSADTENEASSQAISTEVIENADESELTSSENLSKINFADSDETEPVKVDEIPEEMTGLPQKTEESEDAVEEASSETISTEAIEKTDELEINSSEKNTELDCQPNDSNSEILAEPQEYLMKTNKSGSPLKDMNSSESDIELTKSIAKEVNDANNESGTRIICQIEDSCESSEPENNISPCTENDAFSGDNEAVVEMEDDDSAEIHVSEVDCEVDAAMVIVEDKNEPSEIHVEMEDDDSAEIHGSEVDDDSAEIHVSEVDCEVDASMVIAEDKNEASEQHSNVSNDDAKNYGVMFFSENNEAVEEIACVQDPEETFSAEDKAIEIASDNQNSEEMLPAENKAVDTSSDIQNSEEVSSAEKKVVEIEELEFRTSSEIEESKEYVEKDAVVEVCIEPSSEGNTTVLSVADSQSSEGNMNAYSLVRNEAEADSETTDVQIGNEGSKENADVFTTVASAPIISEQKDTDVPIQPALKDHAAAEVEAVGKICKENKINDDDLLSKSLRELRKMVKNLTLENKTDNDKRSNKNSVKEVERKRTALQELPENRMPVN